MKKKRLSLFLACAMLATSIQMPASVIASTETILPNAEEVVSTEERTASGSAVVIGGNQLNEDEETLFSVDGWDWTSVTFTPSESGVYLLKSESAYGDSINVDIYMENEDSEMEFIETAFGRYENYTDVVGLKAGVSYQIQMIGRGDEDELQDLILSMTFKAESPELSYGNSKLYFHESETYFTITAPETGYYLMESDKKAHYYLERYCEGMWSGDYLGENCLEYLEEGKTYYYRVTDDGGHNCASLNLEITYRGQKNVWRLEENEKTEIELGDTIHLFRFTPSATSTYCITGEGFVDNYCMFYCYVNGKWQYMGDVDSGNCYAYLYEGVTYQFKAYDDGEHSERVKFSVKNIGRKPELKSGPYKTTYILETEHTVSTAGIDIRYPGTDVSVQGNYYFDGEGDSGSGLSEKSTEIIVEYRIVDGKYGEDYEILTTIPINVVSADSISKDITVNSPIAGEVSGNTDCYRLITGRNDRLDYYVHGNVNAKVKIYDSNFRIVYDAGWDEKYDVEKSKYIYPQKETVALQPNSVYYVMLIPDHTFIGNSYHFSMSINGISHTHNWSDWKTTAAAACTKKGQETRECYTCGTSETREVEALGHKAWSNWRTTAAATCTKKGQETRKCYTCGTSEVREVKALGHKAGTYVITKAPTYFKSGIKTSKCVYCGLEMSKKPIAVLKINAPAKVKIKKVTKNAVTLKWKKDNTVTGYKIYRSTKRKSGYKLVKKLPKKKTSYTDKKVKKGKTYYYKMVAYAKSGKTTCTSKGIIIKVKTKK